jgi:hypothetical protein
MVIETDLEFKVVECQHERDAIFWRNQGRLVMEPFEATVNPIAQESWGTGFSSVHKGEDALIFRESHEKSNTFAALHFQWRPDNAMHISKKVDEVRKEKDGYPEKEHLFRAERRLKPLVL